MKGEKGFDDAQGDMKEAEGDLKGGQGKPGKSGQSGKGGQSGKARRSTRKAVPSSAGATATRGCRNR